ncbi:MAG: hypothetical protein ACLRXQ_13145 [Phascolarctobacterium faecium]
MTEFTDFLDLEKVGLLLLGTSLEPQPGNKGQRAETRQGCSTVSDLKTLWIIETTLPQLVSV